MYGKHYESMYTGSMRGKGSAFFAVWGYVISHAKPSKAHGSVVELNPEILAFLIGEKQEVVDRVILEFQQPDPKSRTPDEEGRKLVSIGGYEYRVVNGAYYRGLRTAEERREYNREKQAEYRAALKRLVEGGMTMEDAKVYIRELRLEYRKRKKEAAHEGGCAGAIEAVREGFAEVQGGIVRPVLGAPPAGAAAAEGGLVA